MGFPGSVLLSQGEIYKESSTKVLPMGTRGYTRDGRSFRYAKSSAAIAVGRLVQAATISALDDAQALAASTDVKTTYSTDSHKFYLSSKSSMTTANAFRDGTLFISSGTGIGQYAQVKSHDNWTAAASKYPSVTIYPEDSFSVKPTTSVKVGLIRNVYDDVKVADTSVAKGAWTGMMVGVTPRAISAADKYFWLQTWGPCACRTQAALHLGRRVIATTATNSTDGTVGTPTSSTVAKLSVTQVTIGQCLQVGAANTAALIYLQLAP